MVKHSQRNIIRWRGKLPDVEMPSLAVLNDGAAPWSAWSWNGNASKTFSATTVQWPVVLFLLFRKCRIGTVNEAGTMILVWPNFNTDRFILEFPGTRWILNNLFLFSATRDGVVNRHSCPVLWADLPQYILYDMMILAYHHFFVRPLLSLWIWQQQLIGQDDEATDRMTSRPI